MRSTGLAALVAPLTLLFLGARIQPARADNPLVQVIYTADPAPVVYNNRVYLFADHDENNSTTYNMKDWHLYSTADMQNWQDHGVVMSLTTFSWANANAWAGQVAQGADGRFYYYAPMRHTTGSMAIGVGVSDTITGPYTDALGKPLIEDNEIDPTVFQDTDGTWYLYWGNPDLYYVKLNSDMLSYSGSPTKIPLTVASFGTRTNSVSSSRPSAFEEGPWFYKRNGIYYMVYAANCCSEDIRHATSPGPTGPWTYHGIIMPYSGKSFTNHPGVIDFAGNSYFFYHNGALPGGSGYTRSICAEQFTYNSDGTIPTIAQTSAGPAQVGTLNPYVQVEAETMAWSVGVQTEVCSEGGIDVSYINNGDYIKVRGVAFGSPGATSFAARVASDTAGGNIEVRLGSVTGTLVGTCTVPGTGSWTAWTTVTCPISGATGTQDVYFHFTGSTTDNLFNFNWWKFSNGSGSSTTATSSTTGTVTSTPTTVTTSKTTTSSSSPTASCAAKYGQCGGTGFSGATCCVSGSTCTYSNAYYSQCL